MSFRLFNPLRTPTGRGRVALVFAVIILIAAIGAHIYGRYVTRQNIVDRDATIQQLRGADQKFQAEITRLNAELASTQANLASTKADLESIKPAKDTFSIAPNEAIIIGDGQLNVGLVGAPAIESVNIDINGKQQSAIAGEVIDVPSTNCRVRIQSFDMFKAVITASCAKEKSQ